MLRKSGAVLTAGFLHLACKTDSATGERTYQSLHISGKAGKAVWGGLYFLPAARIIVHGPLFTDFVTRKDFILGELPEGLFRELKDQTGTIRISLGNVAEMAMREYPLVQLDPAWVEALNTPEPQARTGGP
jgi:hypothetical protein